MPENSGKKIRPRKKITQSYLHNAGLYYLQRFASSSAQFRKVMTRKITRSCEHHCDLNREECLAMLDALIADFTRCGLLNDDAYLKASIESYRRRGLSSRSIACRLSQKGIDPQEILHALSGIEENDSLAAIRLAKKRKLGAFGKKPDTQSPAPCRDDSRELAIFARAGFSYETARSVLCMSIEEAESQLKILTNPY